MLITTICWGSGGALAPHATAWECEGSRGALALHADTRVCEGFGGGLALREDTRGLHSCPRLSSGSLEFLVQ